MRPDLSSQDERPERAKAVSSERPSATSGPLAVGFLSRVWGVAKSHMLAHGHRDSAFRRRPPDLCKRTLAVGLTATRGNLRGVKSHESNLTPVEPEGDAAK
jgi:hypothetical protein